MAKQKYYRIDQIKKEEADYNILLGERSNGKSYAVKEEVLTNAWNGELGSRTQFIYLRRWETDVKPQKCEKYFEDMPIAKITEGICNCIACYRTELFFAYNNGDKIERVKKCGDVMYLSGYVHFKSIPYPLIYDLIFEEFVAEDGVYLGDDEVDKLMSLISTIARRNRIRVWLIANVISRMCPYFSEWELRGIPKQKQGTIEIYNVETTQQEDDGSPVHIKIAVEFCENSGNNSKMFFGSKSQMITSGAWACRPQPHLPHKYKTYDVLYGVNILWGELHYNLELLKNRDDRCCVAFCYPASKIKYSRIVDRHMEKNSPLITDKLYPITKGDKILLTYIKINKLFYSDNLTGSEFEDILEKIM